MQELINQLLVPLNGAGVTSKALDVGHRTANIEVAGCHFQVSVNYRGTVTLDWTKFRRRKDGTYNIRKMVTTILGSLPRLIEQKKRGDRATDLALVARQVQEMWDDPRLRLNFNGLNSESYTLSFTHVDINLIVIIGDRIREMDSMGEEAAEREAKTKLGAWYKNEKPATAERQYTLLNDSDEEVGEPRHMLVVATELRLDTAEWINRMADMVVGEVARANDEYRIMRKS